MLTYITAYISAAIAFLALDYLWLTRVAKPLYSAQIGSLLLERPRFGAAAAFYLLYVVGIVVFAIVPALAAGSFAMAAGLGALFGFLAYATYDVTNYATLRAWPFGVACLDIVWAGSAVPRLIGIVVPGWSHDDV